MGDAEPRESTGRRSRGRHESVGRSLLVWIAVTTVAAFAVYGIVTQKASSHQWSSHVETDADQVADLIMDSARYAMELNRKEDLHRLLHRMGGKSGVEGIRIYDKVGRVIASADQSEIGRTVDLETRACVVCHRSGETHETVPADSRTREFETRDGSRVLAVVRPIHNAPECAVAGCHAGAGSPTLLGVLDVTMSMREADRRIAATARNVWIAAAVVVLLVGFVSASFVERVVRRPVRRLTAGARQVASGDLDARIDVDRDDEIGELARTFNSMTSDLGEARRRLTDWSRDLERTVIDKTEELARAQRHATQVERMASLGRLAATVAHELNNPLAGIVNYARLVERDVRDTRLPPDTRDELLRCIDLIRRESKRSGDIVRNLLLFARPSTGGRIPIDPREIVERAVMLVRHHVEVNRIELVVRTADDAGEMTCDPDQVQQALVALMINAVEAMPDGGRLELRLERLRDGDRVRFVVRDDGVGIPEDIQARIFEPFFSTKEGVHGLGLGLSVVYGIVRSHRGEIDVDSRRGEGTTFTIDLPRTPERSSRSGDPGVTAGTETT